MMEIIKVKTNLTCCILNFNVNLVLMLMLFSPYPYEIWGNQILKWYNFILFEIYAKEVFILSEYVIFRRKC